MRKSLFLILVAFILNSPMFAQKLVIENKGSVSLSIGIGIPMGSITSGEPKVFPSLLRNYKTSFGSSIHYKRWISKHFGAGASFGIYEFSNWGMNEATIYDQSKVLINAYQIDFSYKTKFTERGWRNRILGEVGISPTLFHIRTDFPAGIYSETFGIRPPLIESSTRPGFSINLGMEVAINSFSSIKLSASDNFLWIDSNIYPDKLMNWLQISLGVAVRLNNNKKYLHDYL